MIILHNQDPSTASVSNAHNVVEIGDVYSMNT